MSRYRDLYESSLDDPARMFWAHAHAQFIQGTGETGRDVGQR